MSTARVALWAAHWTAATTAAIAAVALTGHILPPAAAPAAALTLTGGIGLITLATTPTTTRKDSHT